MKFLFAILLLLFSASLYAQEITIKDMKGIVVLTLVRDAALPDTPYRIKDRQIVVDGIYYTLGDGDMLEAKSTANDDADWPQIKKYYKNPYIESTTLYYQSIRYDSSRQYHTGGETFVSSKTESKSTIYIAYYIKGAFATFAEHDSKRHYLRALYCYPYRLVRYPIYVPLNITEYTPIAESDLQQLRLKRVNMGEYSFRPCE